MHKRFLPLILTTSILLGLVWIAIVPIWHFPDEQVHFGEVAFLAETKSLENKETENDLTEEIYVSEIILGTNRDKLGNNKFTFHPEYKTPYSDSLIGIYEASISASAKNPSKRDFVAKGAAKYPPLYYLPAALIYRLFYAEDLFTRVNAVRIWSLTLFIGNLAVIYALSSLFFRKKTLLNITMTILIGFQPMVVFANVGVNSDSLGNLLFTLFLYFCTRMILCQLNIKKAVTVISLAILSIYTKPQFLVMVPLLFILFFYLVFRDIAKERRVIFFKLIFISLLFFGLFIKFYPVSAYGAIKDFLTQLNLASLLKYTREYTFPHTYKEVLPWYWGVYDWLGVTYPRYIHKIINRVIIFSLVGYILHLIKNIRGREYHTKQFQAELFLLFTSISYFIFISLYDWLSWFTSKYPLGVQGRYFFPTIYPHMLFLLIGWSYLFPEKWNLKEWGIKLLGMMMVALNGYALYTVAKTYYDLSSFSKFLLQVSQYKPWFFKGTNFIVLTISYLIILSAFLLQYLMYGKKKSKED